MVKRIMRIPMLAILTCGNAAIDSAEPQPCPPGEFRQDVFDGTAVWGEPKLSTCRPWGTGQFQISIDWGLSGPTFCVNNCPGKGDELPQDRPKPIYTTRTDGFSMRFEGDLQLDAGTYEFAVQSDDGTRIRLDGELIYEDWQIHAAPAQPWKLTKRVTAGSHHLLVEYFEGTERALVRIGWKRVGP